MIEKGQKVELEIVDMTNEGQGLGKLDSMAVFVQGAILGDVVEAEITKVKKNYAFGSLIAIKKPSEYRIDPVCRYSAECGGCSLQSMSYEGQLMLKNKIVKDKLIRIGGLENPVVHNTIGMSNPTRYRNKAQFPVNGGKLNLTCNGNGNTAIDASGTYSNNGGSITTNDGSESGAGMGTGGGRPSGGSQFPGNGERPEGINSPDGGMSQRPEGMKTPKDSIGELPQ